MAQQTAIQKSQAAQRFLPIQEVRDGIAITKDKSMHIVLMASSINFALKSVDEQDAIIAQYQNLLNSLDFSLQFFIQSRKLDIEPYLDTLREALQGQTNELIKIQTREYIEFVKNFVQATNIVSKTFYAVVSYVPPLIKANKGGIAGQLSDIFKGSKEDKEHYIPDEEFEEYKIQIWQRVNSVATGLARTGVRVVPLNTEELIELYYSLFNPGEIERGGTPHIEATIAGDET
ncbi:MAG: TraC family protein [bacterium]|nr:TraC family protein [bacterium]